MIQPLFPYFAVFQDYVSDTEATYLPCTSNCTTVECVNVEIIDDENVEVNQTFQMRIIGVNLGSISPSQSTTVITIMDNTGAVFASIHKCV